ncbi:MAG: cytidine deaminase [Spirochaetales bacterium]|nr:cytidine deaminase [Spirochaetales bacterium]
MVSNTHPIKTEDLEKLLKAAAEAGKKSYSPYSNFRVGAAALSENDEIFSGCNIENRSYPAGICAEITAVSKLISSGAKEIKAIAVIGLDSEDFLPPCGVCRQFITEFGNNFPILMANKAGNYKVVSSTDLLPSDSLHDLKKI